MSPPTAELQAAGLTPAQAQYVEDKLGRVTLVKDMSWGDIDSTVLQVARKVGPFIVKACGTGTGRHHFDRDIAAFQAGVTERLGSSAARLLHADKELGVMVLSYLPGSLVFDSPFALDADTHRQAGRLLRLIHADPAVDNEWDAKTTRRALGWLDKPHRIPASDAALARLILEDRISTPHPVEVVDTHGDYHPRNWLRDDNGTVKIIDWGRYERRPAFTDFVRCACQEWAAKPELGYAFAEGYGQDLRDTDDWKMEYLRQAIGTACWAPTIGDEKFEAQGIRMVAQALELLRPLATRLQREATR